MLIFHGSGTGMTVRKGVTLIIPESHAGLDPAPISHLRVMPPRVITKNITQGNPASI